MYIPIHSLFLIVSIYFFSFLLIINLKHFKRRERDKKKSLDYSYYVQYLKNNIIENQLKGRKICQKTFYSLFFFFLLPPLSILHPPPFNPREHTILTEYNQSCKSVA